MNWRWIRRIPWIDSRSLFVSTIASNGRLLDIGSSDGGTLTHIAELRPDLILFATDIHGAPDQYPSGCSFFRCDIQKDNLPWGDACMNAVTCMHLVEHLDELEGLFSEISRLLMPGGKVYFETPHPKTAALSNARDRAADTSGMSFYSDPTHKAPVPVEQISSCCSKHGLTVLRTGTARNLLFAAAQLLYVFLPPSRQKFTAKRHWIGWSVFLVAQRPE